MVIKIATPLVIVAVLIQFKERDTMNMLRSSIMILMLLIVPLTHADAAQKYLKISDKTSVELSQLLKDAESADVIFIGETP